MEKDRPNELSEQTLFTQFAITCRALESTTKRTEKVAHLAKFLKSINPSEIVPAVCFLIGRPFPESDSRVLDVGGQTIWKINRHSGQSTLISKPVTILEVYDIFGQIATASGTGSRQRKENLIDVLLSRLPEVDAHYLMRIVFGEMRIGAVEGIMLDAVADATMVSPDLVRRAYMLLGDMTKVAELVLTKGSESLTQIGVTLFVPIKPMLAEVAQDAQEVIKEHGGVTALSSSMTAHEYKYTERMMK